ncbi:hypothetical protein BC936DRAFT_148116 [Jimgerdemannia flammicorona]|uniref:non-specific serine/threonine protein kinase n=1 Tax=Jimgerdemannia flammicorona TaxID=994334 RepID=A0A433D3Q7_9FUNG|nr:hypothetical protein BC936DRAFT_148116 [Jimgerdemannia flammicorona]
MADPETVLITIDGKIYDVAGFLEDHPGGRDILLEHQDKVASEGFHDVGHSDEAKKLMRDFYVRDVVPTAAATKPDTLDAEERQSQSVSGSSSEAKKEANDTAELTVTKDPVTAATGWPYQTRYTHLWYILSSGLAALILVITALSTSRWSDFSNQHPASGEMGFGHFLIKGTREDVKFFYPWRLQTTTDAARATAWAGYVVHQVGQWTVLYLAQRAKAAGEMKPGWSDNMRKYNWWMFRLNAVMIVYKFLQSRIFYDGLAVDVPEGTALGSVATFLVVILIIEIPRRGIFFGRFKSLPLSGFKEMIAFTRKYHGYMISFGLVYDFHYHPCEGSVGHFGGFWYQFMLFWQSSLFYNNAHRNRNWTLLLETWVWLHGTLTAVFQPGTSWLNFSYGFFTVFVLTQVWGIPFLADIRPILRVVFLATCMAIYFIFVVVGFTVSGNWRKIYNIFFVPAADYGFLVFYYLIWAASFWVIQVTGLKGTAKVGASILLYVIVNTVVVLGYGLVLQVSWLKYLTMWLAENFDYSTMIEGATLIKQGAEARIYTAPFLTLPNGCIAKERFTKAYRHPVLDKKLTARRVVQEARCLHKCLRAGIDTPTVYFVDVEGSTIYMEYVLGKMVRNVLLEGIKSTEDVDILAGKIGAAIAKMHAIDIVHGDLTTSNLLLRDGNESLVVIDFGLSYVSNLPEDKAVDLYVLERAFLSTHPNSEQMFAGVLDAYERTYNQSKPVMFKLEDDTEKLSRPSRLADWHLSGSRLSSPKPITVSNIF